MSFVYDLLNRLQNALYPDREIERELFVQAGTIPFAIQTGEILNKKFSPKIKVLSISLEGNLKNTDRTFIRLDSKEYEIFGLGFLTLNVDCARLRIDAFYGTERYGRVVLAYEGGYFKPFSVGTVGMPQNVVDYIDLINLINTINTIASITDIVNIQSVDLIDAITNIGTLNLVNTISEISNISSLDLIDCITLIDTVTNIGTIANVTNLGTLNLVNTISQITNVANVQSIDLIDLITKVSEITTVKTVDKITEITEIKDIKTVGGDNIFIDLLKQGSYKERRSAISNHGATPAWASVTGNTRYGKFFTKDCMGFIETIYVYCKNDGATERTITVYISPNPSLGFVAMTDITVPASATPAWRTATFNRMWLSDKLFVFISSNHIDVKHSYDTGTPCDSYTSTDSGASWTPSDHRRWIQVNMVGETVGDVIPSLVNNIEIPNASAKSSGSGVSVGPNTLVKLLTVEGSGKMIEGSITFMDLTVPSGTVLFELYIYSDGVYAYSVNNRDLTQNATATSGCAGHGEFYQVALASTTMNVRVPVEFKRKIEIYARHSTENTFNCFGFLSLNLMK